MYNPNRLIAVLLPCLVLFAAAVAADPPGFAHGRGHGHGHGHEYANEHEHEHEYEHEREHEHEHEHEHGHGFSGGPPPWAPAHGYRRHEGGGDAYASLPVNVQTGSCNREMIGRILGGATGGLVGAQVSDSSNRLLAVAAGTVVGALIGGEIGHEMDRSDKLCVDQTLEHAPDGTKIHWNDGNQQYTVTPEKTEQNSNGQYCREYTMQSNVSGQNKQVYGKACRQPDGSWRIVS